MNPIILRQVAESESFRWIVERRHLLEAAETIEQLHAEITMLQTSCDQHIAARNEMGDVIDALREELAQERDYARELRQQAAGKDRP